MKRKKLYKTLAETKLDIEERLKHDKLSWTDNELCIASGIQLRHNITHFPSPLNCVTYRNDTRSCAEFYIVNYMSADGGESVIAEWKYNPKDGSSRITRRVVIRQCLKFLTWINLQQTIIGMFVCAVWFRPRTKVYFGIV